jgi:glycosyltransferase involved in cell wall biosynthesis
MEGKFVVMYSGNVGQTQRFDMLLSAAERLQSEEDIVFMIVGGGVRGESLQEAVKRRGLENVRFLPYQPKSFLSQSLSAADVQIVMLDESMTQLMMPSKLYSALAAGSCIVGFGEPNSHLAEIITENECGWFYGESQLEELVDRLRQLSQDRSMVETVGQTARHLAVEQFDRVKTIGKFGNMLGKPNGLDEVQMLNMLESVGQQNVPVGQREVEFAKSR